MGGVRAVNDEERERRRKIAAKKANEKYFKKVRRLHLTLTEEESELIKRVAKRAGITPTTYVHGVAVERARQDEKREQRKSGL